MLVPTQGPAVSKMIVSWSSTVVASNAPLAIQENLAIYDPQQIILEKAGAANNRAPVAQGVEAIVWLKSQWQRVAGSETSMAATYLAGHNTQ